MVVMDEIHGAVEVAVLEVSRTATGFTVSATGYTITVGAGGATGSANTPGNAGGNSVFSSITSTGGGGGGAYAFTGTLPNWRVWWWCGRSDNVVGGSGTSGQGIGGWRICG